MRPDFHFPSSHANIYKGKLSLLDCSMQKRLISFRRQAVRAGVDQDRNPCAIRIKIRLPVKA